jgi:hypothetical protein
MVSEMALVDPQLHVLVQAADQQAGDVLASAAVKLDLRGRQLSVLRNTYPGWDIEYEPDAAGRMWWKARLRPSYTLEMATAGVLQFVERPDAIALASTLAWQTALVHSIGPFAR